MCSGAGDGHNGDVLVGIGGVLTAKVQHKLAAKKQGPATKKQGPETPPLIGPELESNAELRARVVLCSPVL